MNQTLFLSQLRVIILVGIAFATGKGWLSSADSSAITSILIPLGVIAGPWIWSIYSNINSKLVPQHAVVIDPVHTEANADKPTAMVQTAAGTITGKVVSTILVAFALSFLLASGSAQAQVRQPLLKPLTGDVVKDFSLKPPAAQPGTGTATDTALGSFGAEVKKITKEIVDKAIADVQSASDDADKHKDTISKPCWDANLALLKGLPSQWENPPQDIGIALGIQIQRDLLNSITGNDATSLKVACAALWGDQLKIVANVGALLGIRLATGGLF